MNPVIMKALIEGAALLVGSIMNTAAKKGLAIMLLLGAIIVLGWLVLETDARRRSDNRDLTAKVDAIETKLEMCNAERAALAVKVAALETRIELLNKKTR